MRCFFIHRYSFGGLPFRLFALKIARTTNIASAMPGRICREGHPVTHAMCDGVAVRGIEPRRQQTSPASLPRRFTYGVGFEYAGHHRSTDTRAVAPVQCCHCSHRSARAVRSPAIRIPADAAFPAHIVSSAGRPGRFHNSHGKLLTRIQVSRNPAVNLNETTPFTECSCPCPL